MIDYRPDHAQDGPGVLSACKYAIPDRNGAYRNSFAAATASLDNALNSTCLGSRMVRNASGTAYLLAGTATKLYKVDFSAATDITRTVGGAYAATNWWFEQFGNEFIACNIADATQTSTGSNFAALAGAPKAAVMIAQRGHLLAFNYDDGSAVPNGVKWASQNSTTTWTPATGNTAGAATLSESPGKIVGAAAIHEVVVAWKKRSMYVGQKVGGSTVWEFNMISPYIGLAGQEAWVATPVGLIFMSNNGVFLYDGSVPRPIDDGVRQSILSNTGANATGVVMSHDEASGVVFIWIPTIGCWAYSYLKDKWSMAYDATGGVIQIGGTTYTDFKMAVRDADYSDYIQSIGGLSNSARRCHLIWTNDQKCVNQRDGTGQSHIDPTFTVQTIRDQKASPIDETELREVVPIYGYDSEAGQFSEPTLGVCAVTPKSRMSGGEGTVKQNIMDTSGKRRFDMGNISANTFSVTLSFPANKLVLSDIAYSTAITGKR